MAMLEYNYNTLGIGSARLSKIICLTCRYAFATHVPVNYVEQFVFAPFIHTSSKSSISLFYRSSS